MKGAVLNGVKHGWLCAEQASRLRYVTLYRRLGYSGSLFAMGDSENIPQAARLPLCPSQPALSNPNKWNRNTLIHQERDEDVVSTTFQSLMT